MKYSEKKNNSGTRTFLSALLVSTLVWPVSYAMAQSDATADAAQAQTELDNASALRERYPDDSIHSPERARQALAEVKKMRARIDARYEKERRLCYPRFFTNLCLNKVKDRQREDLAAIRPIEIEAEAFNRKQRVIDRDRRLAEKAAQDAKDRKERQIPVLPAKEPDTDGGAAESGEKDAQRKVRAQRAAEKRAAFAEAQRQREVDAANEAAKRAENVEKYKAKVEEYEARQREMAQKQTENAPPQDDKAP